MAIEQLYVACIPPYLLRCLPPKNSDYEESAILALPVMKPIADLLNTLVAAY